MRCGGHFEGGTVLHWAGGASGKGALLTGDILQVDSEVLDVRPAEGEVNDVELQGDTPGYLSPEQAWGRAKEIGPADPPGEPGEELR